MTSSASADITGFGNGSGFTFNNFLANGVIGASNGVLTISTASPSEAASAFYDTQQAIGHFSAAFTYQNVTGNGADGFTFVVQSAPAGANALGGDGYNLGYGGDAGTANNSNPITSSVAYGIELWPNPAGSTGGFGQDGAINANGSTAAAFTSTSPVNAELTDKINFSVTYNGTTLSVNMADPTTGASYSTSETVDIPTVVGSSLAYVGFTGGTGGAATEQQISNFSYTTAVPEPAPLGALVIGGAISLLMLKRRRTA
jgi:hypothetical protein